MTQPLYPQLKSSTFGLSLRDFRYDEMTQVTLYGSYISRQWIIFLTYQVKLLGKNRAVFLTRLFLCNPICLLEIFLKDIFIPLLSYLCT